MALRATEEEPDGLRSPGLVAVVEQRRESSDLGGNWTFQSFCVHGILGILDDSEGLILSFFFFFNDTSGSATELIMFQSIIFSPRHKLCLISENLIRGQSGLLVHTERVGGALIPYC